MCLRSMTATKRSRQREGSFSVINDGRSPGKTPSLGGDSRAKDSSHQSPRSGVNVVGLRPSLIAQHSLRSPSSKSTHSGMAVFQRSAPGAAREKHLPFAEIRGHENPEPRKTQKCTKSCSGASLIGGNARSSPPPRPFQLLGVLGELGVGRFHAKGAKPAKGGGLGRSPFCGFSWQFPVARHRRRV